MTSRWRTRSFALVLALVLGTIAVALYQRRSRAVYALSVEQCLANRTLCRAKVPLRLSGAIAPGTQARERGECATAFDLQSPGGLGSPAGRIRVCVDHELQPFKFYMADEKMLNYLERGVVGASAEGTFDGNQFTASDVFVSGSDSKFYAWRYGP